MATSPQDATCVFCNRPIGPHEPTSGRPPMAAHVACADAALADDRHWDAVAGAQPGSDDQDESAEREEATPRRRSLGCLTIAVAAMAVWLAFLP